MEVLNWECHSFQTKYAPSVITPFTNEYSAADGNYCSKIWGYQRRR
jgi:hypothetical protein